MENTWPGGKREALLPHEHEKWNGYNYPGTRQLCCLCEEPTGRCEEDSIYVYDKFGIEIGPLCEECYYNKQDDWSDE